MTSKQKAQECLVKASKSYNHILKQAVEDPDWVGRHVANIVATLGELIDAVGYLTDAEKK